MRFDLWPPRQRAFVVIIELFPQKFGAKKENPTIECRKERTVERVYVYVCVRTRCEKNDNNKKEKSYMR